MPKFNLEIDGKNKSTTKGNVDWYYGGGNEAWVDIASAKAGVPLALRNGKTVGVIETNKIVEYIWHNDNLTDNGLVLKTAGGNSNLTAQLTAGVTVGGVTSGDVFADASPQEAVIRAILSSPLVLPTYTPESININVNTLPTGLVEVGSLIAGTLNVLFDQGLIDSKDANPDVALKGAGGAPLYSDIGINSVTGVVNTPALLGNNSWVGQITYIAGSGLYYDSQGNAQNNLDAFRALGSIQTGVAITGIYPFLYGTNNLILTGSTFLYDGVTKDISAKSNKIVALNGTDTLIYFAYPASYGDLTKILDGNGFNVTSSFTKWVVNVDSTGLNSNWAGVSYIMYRTNAYTTVNDNFTFQF